MGTTSNRSWPYPESSDFVADGATAIENLADAIDASIGNGYAYVTSIVFTSSGTFTKASYPWLAAVLIRVQAGGGAGGGAAACAVGQGSGGAGGGGGGYAERFLDAASLAASETVTVGAGATGGTGDGPTGGTSSFGSLVSATGGSGGTARPASAVEYSVEGGNGGVGSTSGTGFKADGSAGTSPYISGGTLLGFSGTGGASHLGGGARGRNTISGGQRRAGITGFSYGGGGGGALHSSGGTPASTGGDGAPGIIIVELYA